MLSTPQLRLTKRRNSLTHPEPKSAGPDGAPLALDRRAASTSAGHRHPSHLHRQGIDRLEEVENDNISSWDEIRETYQDPRTFRWYVIPILRIINCAELMARTGCSERHIKAIRNGHGKPSAKVMRILVEMAAEFARQSLLESIADDHACAAFVRIGGATDIHDASPSSLFGEGSEAYTALPRKCNN